MPQHFLLSAAARSLTLTKVARMSEDEARQTFQAIRWADTQGEPVCPRCGVLDHSYIATRKLWQCKGCNHQYSVTSGTIFSSRKLGVRDYLLAIAVFANGAKGHSALQLSRDLGVQYRTAFVLSHKLREAMSADPQSRQLSGTVEIDGAYFGGHIKPANAKAERKDRRRLTNGKRQVVTVMRERDARAVTTVASSEAAAVPTINQTVEVGSTVHADESTAWDALHVRFDTHRINHSVAYSTPESCTNQAESFFSRLRRAEIGTHHHIAGPYLAAYASEMAWRENYRRVSNGALYVMIADAALAHPVSRQWKGYWQR